MLGTGMAIGAAAAVAPYAGLKRARADEPRDYSLPATYDWAQTYFRENSSAGGDVNNEAGTLVWQSAYALRSYLPMYRATSDTKYLDLLIHYSDQVLDQRDSVRGVTEYRGQSLPSWRSGDPYTVATAAVSNGAEDPILEIRSAAGNAAATIATIADTDSDTFSLTVTNSVSGVTETFDDLTMDPQSSRYAVTVLLNLSPTKNKVTLKDLRPAGATDREPPAPTSVMLESLYDISACSTGHITMAMAEFAATVAADVRLNARYGAVRRRYAEAVADALAIHDGEWHEEGVGSRATAWYSLRKGSPWPYDGVKLPHNQYLVMAASFLHLGAATNEPEFNERGRKMLRGFRNDLSSGTGPVWWTYHRRDSQLYTGYTVADDVSEYVPAYGRATQIEDISHGELDLTAAITGYRYRHEFTARDMSRFGQTYDAKIATTDANGNPAVNLRVDGTGGAGKVLDSAVWVPISDWSTKVAPDSLAIYNRSQLQPTLGWHLLGIANLVAAYA